MVISEKAWRCANSRTAVLGYATDSRRASAASRIRLDPARPAAINHSCRCARHTGAAASIAMASRRGQRNIRSVEAADLRALPRCSPARSLQNSSIRSSSPAGVADDNNLSQPGWLAGSMLAVLPSRAFSISASATVATRSSRSISAIDVERMPRACWPIPGMEFTEVHRGMAPILNVVLEKRAPAFAQKL